MNNDKLYGYQVVLAVVEAVWGTILFAGYMIGWGMAAAVWILVHVTIFPLIILFDSITGRKRS